MPLHVVVLYNQQTKVACGCTDQRFAVSRGIMVKDKLEGVHKQRVTLGQAGNRRPRAVFISYLISTFYIHMPILPASTINLVSFFAHYLQVAASVFLLTGCHFDRYLLESAFLGKTKGKFVIGTSVSSPLICIDSFGTKYVQVGGCPTYKLTKAVRGDG